MAKDKKVKRKSRHKKAKKLDTLEPITLEQIGSEEDPCFGKHYSPKAEECTRCGDSEICAIAMGQINHMMRKIEEGKKEFKDLEETKIKRKEGRKKLKKQIKNRARKMAQEAGKKGVKLSMVIEDIYASFSKDGFTKEKIKKIIKRCVKNSSSLSLTQNMLSWNKKSQN